MVERWIEIYDCPCFLHLICPTRSMNIALQKQTSLTPSDAYVRN